jgi:hypothetical protein
LFFPSFASHEVDFQVEQFDFGGPGLNVDYVEIEEETSGEPEFLNISANLSEVNRSAVLNATDYQIRVHTKVGNIYNASVEVKESQDIRIYGMGLASANGTIMKGSSGLDGFEGNIYPGRGRFALVQVENESRGENT